MDNLYLTLDKRVSEDLMEFDIQFADEKHPIFQAHFPSNSLLPGFLHIDVAAELLGATIIEIPKAKFIQPILPQDTIQFIITKKESKYLVTTKKENKNAVSLLLSPNRKIIVVIPTYNNPKTITKVAQDVLESGYELIIVDDGSTQKVSDLVEKNNKLTILRHETNLGKGQAILTGAAQAKEFGYEYFVSMDGDGQHLASEISKLSNALDSHNQLIVGSRNFEIKNVPVRSKIGRAFHNFWIKLNSGYDITDSLTGYRLYPVSILDLNLQSKRFNFEAEVLVKHFWKYKNMKDITIECYYPTPEERVSHFDNCTDTISITLLHLKLFMQRIFLLKGIF